MPMKDQAEHQGDREQAAFIVDDAAGDVGMRDADRDHGGGHDGGERQPDARDQFGKRHAAPLAAERGRR